MEIEETFVENNDCDFVDIGGVEKPLSDGNRSWKLCNSVSLPSAEVDFFTQVCFTSFCYPYPFQNCLFTT